MDREQETKNRRAGRYLIPSAGGVLLIFSFLGTPGSASDPVRSDQADLPAKKQLAPPPGSHTTPRPELNRRQRAARRAARSLRSPFQSFDEFVERVFEGVLQILPSKDHLPLHLREREHWDYPWPFRWIPRGWTSFGWGQPVMVWGNQVEFEKGSPKPIGEARSFQVSRYPALPLPFKWIPLYVAVTTPGGTHLRLGARWDDVDDYVQFPSVAIKRQIGKREKAPGIRESK